jgi:23S rRNA-/tRNA-specific pseudouridylate synthase
MEQRVVQAPEEPLDAELQPEEDNLVVLRPQREDLGARLDRYVADNLPDLSRGTVQNLIESGHILVDDLRRKPKFRVTPGEVITVEIPPPLDDEILPDPIPLNIVYEDRDIIVVDKPAGLVVHPAPGHPRGTLANALVAHSPSPGQSHLRIDRGGKVRPRPHFTRFTVGRAICGENVSCACRRANRGGRGND